MIEISRNSKCPCGSGQKYQDCCLPTEEALNSLNSLIGKLEKNLLPQSPTKALPQPPLPSIKMLDIRGLIQYNRKNLPILFQAISIAKVESILRDSLQSQEFILYIKNSDLFMVWRTPIAYGHVQIKKNTGELAGASHSDVALYCLYCMFHRDPFFFPEEPRPKSLLERWRKNETTQLASSPRVQWSKEQIQNFEKIHRQLQGLFGPKKAEKECLVITMRDLQTPNTFVTKKLPEELKTKESSYLWRISGSTLFLLFSDGEIVALNDMNHPYVYFLAPEWSQFPPQPSEELAQLYPQSYYYKLLYNHLPYIRHLYQQEHVLVAINTPAQADVGYLISRLEVLPHEDVSWRFRKEGGMYSVQSFLSSPMPSARRPLAKDVFCHSKTYALHFHDLHTICAEIRSDLNAEMCSEQSCPGLKMVSLRVVNIALERIKGMGYHQLDLGKVRKLSFDEVKFRIHFNSSSPDAFGVALLLPSGGGFLHCPDAFSEFVTALEAGISECININKKDWLSGRQDTVRQGEMKLYRHRGLAIQILLKMLEVDGGKAEVSEEEFWTDFKADLGETINRIAYGAKFETSFESPRFDQLLREIYAKVKTDPKVMVFMEHETLELSLKVYHRLLFSLLRFMAHGDISHLTKSTGMRGKIRIKFAYDEFDDVSVLPLEFNPSYEFEGSAVLPNLIPHLPEHTEVFIDGSPLDELNLEDLRSLVLVKEATNKIDWFELDPRFYFKGEEISLGEALKLTQGPLVEFRGKFFRIDASILPNIKWLEYLWDRLQGFNSPSRLSKSGSNIILLPRSASLEILALRAAGLNFDGAGEQWKKICSEFDSLSQRRSENFVPLLPGVTTPLKDYQKTGVQWMLDLYQLHLGGILADDMGLGKTLQSLSFLTLLQHQGELGNCLVVVPTSLVYNWLSEIRKFTPELEVQVFEANLKKKKYAEKGLMICSYGLFQIHSDFFEAINWNVVIFDEAQNLKNRSSLRCNKARVLTARSKYCLTGTPLENHYGEFYTLIDLVVPGALGPYAPFMSVYGPRKGLGGIEPKDIEFLKLKTQPLVLRRDKKRVLAELPPKTENVILVPFEKQQEKIYRDIALAWNDRIRVHVDKKGEAQSQLQMLTALLRLRQVCSHPASLPETEYNKIPPKIELLVEQVEAILDKGESVLVFTNFLMTLQYIESLFEKHHHTALTLHGGMTVHQRRQVLEEFESSQQPTLLIMTLKTGGVGLNLTKANHVFHLEPWWNPAAENQGTDRVHRMGQEQHVHVVRFVMENSIEEKIQSLKLSKTQCFDALFAESVEELEASAPTSYAKKQLSQADFQALLNLDHIKAR